MTCIEFKIFVLLKICSGHHGITDHYDSGRGDSPESFNSTKLSPPKGRSKSQGQRPQSLVSEDSEISTTSFEDNNSVNVNGSSLITINNCTPDVPVTSQPPPREDPYTRVYNIVKELLETEELYVKDLYLIDKVRNL